MLAEVGLATGGRAGERMTRRLDAARSRTTLLRLLRALPEPTPGVLRAVGVDEFTTAFSASARSRARSARDSIDILPARGGMGRGMRPAGQAACSAMSPAITRMASATRPSTS
jgi:hypothetical protein